MSPVTSRQKLLLHYTLLHLDTDQMGKLFYDHILAAMPEVAPMFTDLESQRKHFMKMMIRIVHTIDEPDHLNIVLRELGHIHNRLHLKPRHFSNMGSAFSNSLIEVMGDRYTPEIGEAWRTLYNRVSEAMQSSSGGNSTTSHSYSMYV